MIYQILTFFFHLTLFSHLSEVPKLSSYAKAEDKLFKYLFGNYQKWVRPVEQLNQTIRVKFGLAISQLVDVVRTGDIASLRFGQSGCCLLLMLWEKGVSAQLVYEVKFKV